MKESRSSAEWFGRYQLSRRIRVGGMAEVWQAKSYGAHGFEKEVALKRILPHIAEDEELLHMFIEEAKIAARLEHPNISRIYELGKTPTAYYITMEFIYGEDLGAIFKRLRQLKEKAPASVAAYVGVACARALAYAHAKRGEDGAEWAIVHRDISPPNVMVSHAGQVKIIDFGIAKMTGRVSARETQVGVLKGKTGYMAPEQLDEMKVDGRADQFALGVTLWETLAGERLFSGATAVDTFDLIRRCDVPAIRERRPDVPEAMAEVIHRALERDRDKRYPDLGAFADALEKAAETFGVDDVPGHLSNWMEALFPEAGEPELSKEEVRELFNSAEARGEEVTDPRLVDDATEIFIPDTSVVDSYRLQVEDLLRRRRKDLPSDSSVYSTHNKGNFKGKSEGRTPLHAPDKKASDPPGSDWWVDLALLAGVLLFVYVGYNYVSTSW